MKHSIIICLLLTLSISNLKAQKSNLSNFIPKDTLALVGENYKYFYVDIWATYCGPCIFNFKFLNRLPKNSSLANVKFITLNLDTDVEKWQNTLIDIKLDPEIYNVRLENENKELFIKTYKCQSIPRYLIFDIKGKLINDKAPGPSNPELIELIEKLSIE
jgi:thiol-disulfide isomerase/thioredoxin